MNTGRQLERERRPCGSPSWISSSVTFSSRIASVSSSENIETRVEHLLARCFGLVRAASAGIVPRSMIVSPLSPSKWMRLHLDEVDDALELVLEADRDLHHHGVVA